VVCPKTWKRVSERCDGLRIKLPSTVWVIEKLKEPAPKKEVKDIETISPEMGKFIRAFIQKGVQNIVDSGQDGIYLPV
jgi:hypothetical protein